MNIIHSVAKTVIRVSILATVLLLNLVTAGAQQEVPRVTGDVRVDKDVPFNQVPTRGRKA